MPKSEENDNSDFEPVKEEEVSEEEVSESDEEVAPKKQKTTKVPGEKRKLEPTTSTESGKEAIFQLSKSRRIAVRRFASRGSIPGKPSIDIREMYTDKTSGELKHGKGICMPIEQWETLKELMPKIDAAVERL